MLFSILIPVYNAEKYLGACLQSVFDQTEQDFEIILCDDASTDNSLSLCIEYIQKHPYTLRLLQNRENEGPLLTRRRLFSASSGEYVLYVDADDQLEPNALRLIKEAILETDADMVLFDAMCIHLDRSIERIKPSLEGNKLYQDSDLSMCYEAFLQSNRLNSLVTKAFRRDLMDAAIDYSPWRQLSLGEDCFQSFPLFDKADSIYYLDQALYRYCKRENSITTSAKPHFYEMRKMLWEREDEYLSAWHIREKTREIVCQNRWNEVINYAIGSATAKPYSVFVKEMEHIRRDGWLSRAMENAHLPGRYRWYSMLLIQRQDMLLFIIMKAENRFIRKRKA